MDDDVNLFDSLACLLEEDGVGDDNDVMSDLETTSGAPIRSSANIKQEKGGKGMKKRKFNPDSDVIAAATDETLKTLELDPNSKEGKQKRRQIRNRLSAQFHRDRKNAHINTLEDEMTRKDNEILALKEQIASLIAENEYLRKLNPGAVLPAAHSANAHTTTDRRDHAMSMGSYSTLHTDTEDGDNSVQSMMFYLEGGASGTGVPLGNAHISSSGSTYSGSSLTASPQHSPFRSDLETSLPSIVFSPQVQAQAQGQRQGQGQSLLIPTGLARPLSLITMVCMVSIMLLSGQQGSMNMTYNGSGGQFQQYQIGEALTVGRELLALMHTAGGSVVETRSSNTITNGNAMEEAGEGRRRRLSESDSDENSVDSAPSVHTDANTLSNLSLTTLSPEEVAAASRGLASLNLDSHAFLSSLQGLVGGANASGTVGAGAGAGVVGKRHNNLRRSHADMEGAGNATAHKRQVIYSSGVVSRGLVEDTYPVYAARSRSNSSAGGGYMGRDLIPHTTHTGSVHSEPAFAHTGDYWPTHSFDYNVQSYSKVILTQGQALLDPSLNLKKNPFTFRGYNTNTNTHNTAAGGSGSDSEGGEGSDAEPTITDLEDEVMDIDTTTTTTSNHSVPVVTVKSEPIATTTSENAIVPVYTHTMPTLPTHTNALLPAVLHTTDVNKLLAESNFMTLKLPASSIRVGKSWADSRDGSVDTLMEVFNISKNHEGVYDDASVEINCIILGAKLVVSQSAPA